MRRLAPGERERRLRFDFEVVARLAAPWLQVAGFASIPALLSARDPVAPGTPGAAPPYVLARYDFRTLAGPGRYQAATVVAFDLLAGGNYPFTPPAVTVLPPLPWNHRVQPASGVVCIGSDWGDAGGQVLLAHLLVQVARILNFDEPYSDSDWGYQPDAIRYWQETLRGHSLHRDLVYPAMPVEFTHGVARSRPALRVLSPWPPTPSPRLRVRGRA
ncbi:hypothetical protein HY631_04510 [Candidatus Uhrbacteria bacterium]|nr:hypothetical protein [Candidatus Uhrbacteria bacterium]